MRMRNQRNKVLDHLKNGRRLTSKSAFNLYGITRLSAVILDLRRKGFDIASDMIIVKIRYGSPTRVASWRLING